MEQKSGQDERAFLESIKAAAGEAAVGRQQNRQGGNKNKNNNSGNRPVITHHLQLIGLQPNLHHGQLYMLHDLNNSGKSQLNYKDSHHVSLYGHEH